MKSISIAWNFKISASSTPNRVEFEAIDVAAEKNFYAAVNGGYSGFSLEKVDSNILSCNIYGLDFVRQKFELEEDTDLQT